MSCITKFDLFYAVIFIAVILVTYLTWNSTAQVGVYGACLAYGENYLTVGWDIDYMDATPTIHTPFHFSYVKTDFFEPSFLPMMSEKYLYSIPFWYFLVFISSTWGAMRTVRIKAVDRGAPQD